MSSFKYYSCLTNDVSDVVLPLSHKVVKELNYFKLL